MHDQRADDTELKVLRRTVLRSTAAGAGLAALGGRAVGDDEGETDEDGDEAADEEEGNGGAEAEFAEVVVDTQVTDGSSVEVESVTLPDGGFVSLVDPVAAHDELPLETMPDLGQVLAVQVQGASGFLEAGTHDDIVIEFEEPLEGERLYQVWAHQDTTGDETLSFIESAGEEDGRYPEPRPAAEGFQEADEILLEGRIEGWTGVEPNVISGQTNPTLVFVEGETYQITWENADGAGHNIEIRDEGDEVVDDYSTDVMAEEGETQTLEFEATSEMAQYVCNPHEDTMVGDIEIESEEDAAENGEDGVDDGDEAENGGDDEGTADEEAEEEAEEGDPGEVQAGDEGNGEEDAAENGEDGADDGEEAENGGEDIHPTQEPPIVMGDVYLHQLREGIELSDEE
ncbi:cupredoxin domain-containing protein [Natrinema soli]|uniref:Plastocyanin/azurin family copper-binding protein n=1 Tax=Natrinema soli TaxID=1930624 RepID=A0ABD5SM19_9EURY|nr:plastocyanin/azurin family copper-binding protein [Natrinema soli]